MTTKHTFLITTLLLLLLCSLYIVLSPKKEVLSSTISLNVGSTPQIKEAGLGLESLIVRGGALLSTVSGNVGIGNSNPVRKLDVLGDGSVTGAIAASSKAANLRVNIFVDESDNVQRPTIWGGGSGESFLILNNTGNVGVGTKNPGAKLAVQDDNKSTSWTTSWFRGFHDNTSHFVFQNSGLGNAAVQVRAKEAVSGAGNTKFAQLMMEPEKNNRAGILGNVERFYINFPKVGIGTTEPNEALQIKGNQRFFIGEDLSNRRGLLISAQKDHLDNGYVRLHSYDYGKGSSMNLVINPFHGGNVGIGTTEPTHLLHVNGVARANQASFATTSDIRLKDITGRYEKGLKEILGINPVIFSYKEDNPLDLESNKEFVGVIAQELQRIIPEAVEEAEDGYLTVNNDAVIWALVNAVKEQEEKINDLYRIIDEGGKYQE